MLLRRHYLANVAPYQEAHENLEYISTFHLLISTNNLFDRRYLHHRVQR
nr:MAG TPA: hypothetical protein [Caudoviricetes sp.]